MTIKKISIFFEEKAVVVTSKSAKRFRIFLFKVFPRLNMRQFSAILLRSPIEAGNSISVSLKPKLSIFLGWTSTCS